MVERAELIKDLLDAFPGLLTDTAFQITSKEDIHYNCIAWAFKMFNDRWMQFDTHPRFDGVWYWWPPGVIVSQSIKAYIDAFKTDNFELCANCELEKGYVKIALYIEDGTDNCTHAARQKINGTWMSKLGRGNDIVHGTPYSLEGESYGKVYCFMKKSR
ncbi:MAG: hypothetical protein WCP85_30585 [Mariniphaga sp.]